MLAIFRRIAQRLRPVLFGRPFRRACISTHFRWTIVRPAAWALVWSAIGFVVFVFIPQGREVSLRLAEDIAAGNWLALVFLILGLIGTTHSIWYAGRSVLYVVYEPWRPCLRWYQQHLLKDHPGAYDRVCARWRRWTPRWAAVLPGVGMAIGLFVATGPLTDVGGKPILIAVVILLVEALVFTALCTRQRRVQAVARTTGFHSIQQIPEDRFTDQAIRRQHKEADEPLDSLPKRTRQAVRYATWGSLALVALLVLPSGLWIAREIGTAFIILISIGLFGFLGTCRLCHPVNRRHYGSVLGTMVIAVLAAAVIGRFGGTDNHAVRQLTSTDAASAEHRRVALRPELEDQFTRWLSLREHLATADNPYPLVVAAAQGGGVRAAMWTSLVLGSLQDRDPNFVCSLFAISGVSGGSVGAIAFAAKLGQPHCGTARPDAARLATAGKGCSTGDRTGLACQLATVFSEDFLAPTLAGALFPDLIQRFVPTGWLAHVLPEGTPVFLPDRQQSLERAWERALPEWRTDEEPRGFVGVVRPVDTAAARPALFLAATEVENGRRWIASDVRLDRKIFVDAMDTLTGKALTDGEPIVCQPQGQVAEFQNCAALTASAAAGLSARFPYVSPPGMLTFADEHGERTYHLLDGGFVDSSGATTASDILRAIRGWCHPYGGSPGTLECTLKRPYENAVAEFVGGDECPESYHCDPVYVRPAVLLLTNSPLSPRAEQREVAERPLTAWFAELGDPARALFSARAGRGRAAHEWLKQERTLMAGRDDLALDVVLQGADDRNDDESVPLGWLVRGKTAAEMERRVVDELNHAVTWICTVYGFESDAEACSEAVLTVQR